MKKMKLYSIVRLDHDYDEVVELGIIATSEDEARKIAFDGPVAGDQNPNDWLDSEKSKCTEILLKKSGFVFQSYCAG